MKAEHLSFLFHLLGALITIVVGYIVAALVRWGFQKAFNKLRGDKTILVFFSHILFWMVVVASAITAVNQTGFYTTSFVAVFGAVFAALIISLQKTLANFAGGFLLLLQRPFRIGDVIEVRGVEGTVIEMNAFLTKIDLGDKFALIPNGIILDAPITVKKQL